MSFVPACPQGYCVQDVLFRSIPSVRKKHGWLTLPTQILARMVPQPAASAQRGQSSGPADATSLELKAALQRSCWEWRHESKPWLRPLFPSLGNPDAKSQRVRCGQPGIGLTLPAAPALPSLSFIQLHNAGPWR